MTIEIAGDEVHLWDTSLALREDEVRELERLLSDDERRRVDQFTNARARQQRVVSRAMRRQLFATYLGVEPRELRFGIEGEGKPVLVRPRRLEFNQTHSGQLLLYAVASTRAVGVDVEHLRPIPRAVELARRFMSTDEQEIVSAASGAERDHAFLSMWVKRESSAKAEGKSVWRALEGYRASHSLEAATASRYAVRVIDYNDEYVAAVAAAGNDWRIVRKGSVKA